MNTKTQIQWIKHIMKVSKMMICQRKNFNTDNREQGTRYMQMRKHLLITNCI